MTSPATVMHADDLADDRDRVDDLLRRLLADDRRADLAPAFGRALLEEGLRDRGAQRVQELEDVRAVRRAVRLPLAVATATASPTGMPRSVIDVMIASEVHELRDGLLDRVGGRGLVEVRGERERGEADRHDARADRGDDALLRRDLPRDRRPSGKYWRPAGSAPRRAEPGEQDARGVRAVGVVERDLEQLSFQIGTPRIVLTSVSSPRTWCSACRARSGPGSATGWRCRRPRYWTYTQIQRTQLL